MFTKGFDSYVCEGDTIECEVDGFTVQATVERDIDYGIDDDDSHNEDQSVTGCNDEQQAKLIEAREAWFDNEWFYCGIVLRVLRNGVELDDHAASLWAIDCNYPGSDNSYLLQVANELLPEALNSAKAIMEKLVAGYK